jgi:hypothetical protein
LFGHEKIPAFQQRQHFCFGKIAAAIIFATAAKFSTEALAIFRDQPDADQVWQTQTVKIGELGIHENQ